MWILTSAVGFRFRAARISPNGKLVVKCNFFLRGSWLPHSENGAHSQLPILACIVLGASAALEFGPCGLRLWAFGLESAVAKVGSGLRLRCFMVASRFEVGKIKQRRGRETLKL